MLFNQSQEAANPIQYNPIPPWIVMHTRWLFIYLIQCLITSVHLMSQKYHEKAFLNKILFDFCQQYHDIQLDLGIAHLARTAVR